MLVSRPSFTTRAVLLLGLRLIAPPASAVVTTDETSKVPFNSTFAFEGHGWGRGLSHYGAQGGASLDHNADEITAFYYPGTARTSRANTLVRVLLQGNAGADTLVWEHCGWSSGVQVTLSDRVG